MATKKEIINQIKTEIKPYAQPVRMSGMSKADLLKTYLEAYKLGLARDIFQTEYNKEKGGI